MNPRAPRERKPGTILPVTAVSWLREVRAAERRREIRVLRRAARELREHWLGDEIGPAEEWYEVWLAVSPGPHPKDVEDCDDAALPIVESALRSALAVRP